MIRGLTRPTYANGQIARNSQAAFPWSWDGLAAYYDPGLGPTGGTLVDHAGRRLNGTLTGGPTWVVGERGHALEFDGTDDFVNLGTNAESPVFALTKASISVRFRTSGAGSGFRALLVKQKAYGLFLNSGILTAFDWSASAGRSAGINCADGKWHHACLVLRSGETNGTEIFLDGKRVLTTTVTVLNQLRGTVIGASYQNSDDVFTQFFGGHISVAYIHSRTLSPNEILLLSQGASPLILRPERRVWVQVGGTTTYNEGGTLSAVGNLTASHSFELVGSGTLSAAGSLTAAHTFSLSGGGSLSAVGTLSGDHGFTLAGSGTLSALGDLTGDQTITLVGSGVLSARAELSATHVYSLAGSGTLSALGELTGSATITLVGSGVLSAIGVLTGTIGSGSQMRGPSDAVFVNAEKFGARFVGAEKFGAVFSNPERFGAQVVHHG